MRLKITGNHLVTAFLHFAITFLSCLQYEAEKRPLYAKPAERWKFSGENGFSFKTGETFWSLLSLSKNPELAAVARKQRYAGLREKCCGTRIRGSAPITPAGGSASCTSTFLTL